SATACRRWSISRRCWLRSGRRPDNAQLLAGDLIRAFVCRSLFRVVTVHRLEAHVVRAQLASLVPELDPRVGIGSTYCSSLLTASGSVGLHHLHSTARFSECRGARRERQEHDEKVSHAFSCLLGAHTSSMARTFQLRQHARFHGRSHAFTTCRSPR